MPFSLLEKHGVFISPNPIVDSNGTPYPQGQRYCDLGSVRGAYVVHLEELFSVSGQAREQIQGVMRLELLHSAEHVCVFVPDREPNSIIADVIGDISSYVDPYVDQGLGSHKFHSLIGSEFCDPRVAGEVVAEYLKTGRILHRPHLSDTRAV